MPISKVKSGSITDSAVTSDKINNSAVTSAKIQDGSIVNADINACAAIASSKLTVDTTALETDINTNKFNISLLGFKMAVNEGLTVFNLVDGVVDEFNDESGTDEAEGSNDTYEANDDFYANYSLASTPISAGFSVSSITEPDTSTAGTNPTQGSGTYGSFTVPCGMTSMSIKVWGTGGSGGYGQPGSPTGGGGGFGTGTLAITPGQSFQISAGEGGRGGKSPSCGSFYGGFGGYGPLSSNNTGGGCGSHGNGGGLAGVFNPSINFSAAVPTGDIPNVYLVAGSGGSGGGHDADATGGAGGGLTGLNGTSGATGFGGSQSAGGAGGTPDAGQAGGFLYGGDGNTGNGGGAGYYGGGAGGGPNHATGGGGSSYYGHPQITCGSTEAGSSFEGGGDTDPAYSPIAPTGASAGCNSFKNNINIGGQHDGSTFGSYSGGDGYVLLTGSYCAVGCTTSSTIVSTAFTSTSVATSSRIVVFEEDIDTPTLNTDIIASVSRDGGTTFTNATLSDSGYVTGSSGQRILTGQADISGQPSGQSMRWKLALANNKVKIHGVSLQWS